MPPRRSACGLDDAGVIGSVGLLSINLAGDVLNGFGRGDWMTLIGLPIGGAMLGYLLTRQARMWFEVTR
jgi:hypothetical protein